MMKPTNGIVTKDNQETMMKLLDSTDSDVEWLNLPPLKGKKPKKKKTMKPMLHNDNSSGCTMWCFLKVFLAVAVITALCLLSIVITWMSGEITDLRDRLKSVESRSQSSVQDLNSFMVKLSDVNKTIHSIQNGKNSLNDVIKNISSINSQISELSKNVSKLSEGLKAAPEIRNIPDKLLTVSKTVVDLGSEVSVMKGQVDSFTQFVKTADTKLEELSNKVTNGTSSRPTDRADLTPDLAHLIQNIPGQLHSLNISLMTQMSLLQSELTEHEQRLGILEGTPSTTSRNMSTISHPNMPAVSASSTVDLKTQVEATLQDLMKNASSSLGIVSLDKTTMLELLANMDNLTQTVQELKEDYGKLLETKTSSVGGDTSNNGELEQLLKSYDQVFNLKITTMNTSLTNLQHDFAHYVTIIGRHSNQLVDLTHQINEIGRFLRPSLVNKTTAPNAKTTTPVKAETPDIFKLPVTAGSEAGNKTSKSPTVSTQAPPGTSQGAAAIETVTKKTKPLAESLGPGGEAKSTLVPLKKEDGTTKAPPVERRPAGETKTTVEPLEVETKTEGPETTTKHPLMMIPRIKNITQLELNFRRWDIMGNRKVLYDSLPGYLGESNMPSEEELEKFDTNGDGMYSLRDLANAFGFNFEDLPADNPFRVHDKEDNAR